MIPQIRMAFSEDDAARIADAMPHLPAQHQARLRDQLWLRVTLIEQSRRLRRADRDGFAARADRILSLLDVEEIPTSSLKRETPEFNSGASCQPTSDIGGRDEQQHR